VLFGYTEYVRFNMINPCQPYAVAMLAAGLGLWSAERAGRSPLRWLLPLACFAVCGWVNFGLVMNLGPWFAFRWLFARRDESREGFFSTRTLELVRSLVLLAFGTMFGMWLKTLSNYPDTPLTFLPTSAWVTGWLGVGRDLWKYFGTNLTVSFALIALGLAWLVVPATRATAVRGLREAAAVVAALVVSFAFIGTTTWTANNGYTARYLFPSLMLMNVAAAGAALAPPIAALVISSQRFVATAACLLVPALAVSVHGWPSLGEARASLEKASGGYTSDILDRNCTHVAGHYWDVWIAVYHANLTLAERGENRVVWGLAVRADPTKAKYSRVPESDSRVAWLVRGGGSVEPPQETACWWQPAYPGLALVELAPRLWLYAAPAKNDDAVQP
jgi:hypothetical protein